MGKKYPDSIGGEIFNYYGIDSNANEASGDYSTTLGYNNKNKTAYSLMCGSNNKSTLSQYGVGSKGSLIAGYNNEVDAIENTAICLGANNRVYGSNQIFIGYDNVSHNSISPKSVCVGRGLNVDYQNLKQKVVLGTYNAQTASLSSENGKLQTIIGGGDSLGHLHNAMEIYYALNGSYSSCVVFPEQIALSNYTTANKAYVNAIVPPTDPNNVSVDEKTLATKAYVDSHTLGITVPRAEVLLTGQSTTVANGASVSLETDLSLTLPDWTKQIRLGIHNSGGYVEYLLVDNVSAHSYVSVTGAGTIDVYSYDPATTTFTFVSGGTSMSIVSVRAEGTSSI